MWDPFAIQWEEGFRALELFRQRERHCRVPKPYRDPITGYRLGPWVQKQRSNQETMSPERRARLDALGFEWEVLTVQWEEGFGALELFRQREGHCCVPQRYRDPITGYRLGLWGNTQRQNKDALSADRRQRLDALGFVWDPFEASWGEGFRFLQLYHQREGHCRVPQDHREQGFRLGQWVRVQRRGQASMSPERRARLDALGFVWDPFATQWEEGFRALELFRQREGHSCVPYGYRDSTAGYRLGLWVAKQRSNRETMSPEHRARLDALGFVWKVR